MLFMVQQSCIDPPFHLTLVDVDCESRARAVRFNPSVFIIAYNQVNADLDVEDFAD
jgi:hypothetical protein